MYTIIVEIKVVNAVCEIVDHPGYVDSGNPKRSIRR